MFRDKHYIKSEECEWDFDTAITKIIKLESVINRLSRKIQKRNEEIKLLKMSLEDSENEAKCFKKLADPENYQKDIEVAFVSGFATGWQRSGKFLFKYLKGEKP